MNKIITDAHKLIANGDADLSVAGKQFCDALTAEQWRVVRGKEAHLTHISEIEGLSRHPHFSDKAHSRQRLYELASLAKLAAAIGEDRQLLELQKGFQLDVQEARNTPSSLAMLGACSIALNNFELGTYYFNKSNSISARADCITGFMALSRAMPSQAVFEKLVPHNNSNNIHFKYQAMDFGKGPISVVAGNSVYINRFIENYANSISEYGTHSFSGIHLHWIQDTDESDDCIDNAVAAAKARFANINVTVEQHPYTVDKKSYYAQSRFLIAGSLIDHYKAPLMITDLDFQLCADPQPTLDRLALIDTSFWQSTRDSAQWAFPWLRSMAGSVWVNTTPNARYFLHQITIGFKATYNPGWYNWGIDQNLLTCALEFCQKTSQINFANMIDASSVSLYSVPTQLKIGIKTQST
ncbi:hypothetical protein [Pseudomonas shirazensis]|uniref:hypothetical protein n=1 Tax=Pseudomonas shirazensis TaxID=2745494 RepID=UPI00398791BB